MPIFEYACRDCRHSFECLVRSGDTPACPACGSHDLDRELSVFGVRTEGGSRAALNRAKAQQQKVNRDRAAAEREQNERHHH